MKTDVYASVIVFLLILFNATAQTKNKIVSGDYEIFKVWCDKDAKNLTMVTDVTEGNVNCSLFISGSVLPGSRGIYRIKGYPLSDTTSYDGTLRFRKGGIEIQLNEAGSCEKMYRFEKGAFLTFDEAHSYHRFAMVKPKKAAAFSKSSPSAYGKGYLLQGDFVSIIGETKGFYKVQAEKKRSFNAWVKKADLIY